MHTESPIPVTVITGLLGSGKTTLINRILAARPAEKIAVIESEYGKAAIATPCSREAEVVELNDGCICCSVRADLIRILGDYAQRIAAGTLKLDRVLIETTGLAAPAPVVQTFFADPVIHARFRLDALLTVVDAEHAMRQPTHTLPPAGRSPMPTCCASASATVPTMRAFPNWHAA